MHISLIKVFQAASIPSSIMVAAVAVSNIVTNGNPLIYSPIDFSETPFYLALNGVVGGALLGALPSMAHNYLNDLNSEHSKKSQLQL